DDAIVVTDADERIVFWNRAATRLYGYERAEVVGRLLPETLSPLWLDAQTRRLAWRAVAASGVWLGEAVHARRDGSPARVVLELSSVRDERGLASGLLLIARPSAAPAAGGAPAPRDPRDAREFLERILNAVADPIFVKDREHRLVLVNEAFCALIGRPRESLLGRADADFMPAAQAEIFARQDDAVFDTGRENVNEELVTDAAGMTHAVVTKKTLWRDAQGTPYLVGVIRDVSELVKAVDDLKRSEERLRHAQRLEAVGRLAGAVAHDFNNVLTAVVGGAGLLLESLPPGHPAREEAEEIRRAGERATTLARQLLSFTRREKGLPRAIDLREVCGGMRRMLQRLLPADIELGMLIPDRLGAVRADPGQAEQILLNLVVNAGDAMEGGGRVEVSLDDVASGPGFEGPGVRLTVCDEGAGMEESVRARAFDPFFTTKAHGTGLGLATVRDLARQAGGEVEVDSAPGRGTTIRVYWPRAEGAPEPAAKTPPPATRRAPRRANVLVVEDDDAVRRFAVHSLERAGYDVLTAADGGEAVRVSDAHEGLFDVVVMDLVLPRGRGVEVARLLRRGQPTARVLYTSGYATDVSSLPAGTGEESAPFLPKPFTSAALSAAVSSLV
ncbi:MAG: PAS domain-containing protein, partial [Elusimicrobia bacterium]|nr:PAS domain-containing protein [Elusimicrobiota bacterium]